jgi:hypothetical protein
MKDTFRFYKTGDGKWYIDLPEWDGSIDDLQMVDGADTMPCRWLFTLVILPLRNNNCTPNLRLGSKWGLN